MPTYTYTCSKCTKSFDANQKITAQPLKKCAYCKSTKVARVIPGPVSFVLRGSGWAKDGY